jgi:hypothetical protein
MKWLRLPVNLSAYERDFAKSRLADQAVRRRRRANKFWKLPRRVQRMLGGRYMGLMLELLVDMAEKDYLNEQRL